MLNVLWYMGLKPGNGNNGYAIFIFTHIFSSIKSPYTASHLLSAMNRSVDPCQNFFEYACGTWNQKHVIPEDRSSVSTFEVLADQQQLILKGLLEESITDAESAATRKAKTFYKTCMDICE